MRKEANENLFWLRASKKRKSGSDWNKKEEEAEWKKNVEVKRSSYPLTYLFYILSVI